MSNLEGKQIPIEAVNYLKTLSRHPLLIEASLATKRRNEYKKQQHASSSLSSHSAAASTSKRPQSSIKSHFKNRNDIGDDGIDSLVNDLSSMVIKKKGPSANPPLQSGHDDDCDDGGGDDFRIHSSHNRQSLTEQKAKAKFWAVNNLTAHPSSSSSSSSSSSPSFDADISSLPANADLFDIIGKTPDTDEIFKGSVKLRVLFKLIRRLLKAGHKTLIFSQSRLGAVN